MTEREEGNMGRRKHGKQPPPPRQEFSSHKARYGERGGVEIQSVPLPKGYSKKEELASQINREGCKKKEKKTTHP